MSERMTAAELLYLDLSANGCLGPGEIGRQRAQALIESAITSAAAAARAEAAQITRDWAKNYPKDVFPTPALAELGGTSPVMVDRISASMARHLCEQIAAAIAGREDADAQRD